MSVQLFKIRVQYKDTNRAFQLDRSKPNIYGRLLLQIGMVIEEDIMLFDGFMIISDETALQAAIDDAVRTHQPHLQLTARPNKMKQTVAANVANSPRSQSPRSQSPRVQSPRCQSPRQEIKKVIAAGETCVECGKPLCGRKFCSNCGAVAEVKKEVKQEVQGDLCGECGKPFGTKRFCMNCGATAKPKQEVKKEEPKKPEVKQEIKKEEPKKEIKQEIKKEEPKKPEVKKETCSNCGVEWTGGKFCSNCGSKKEEPKKEEPKQEVKKDLCPSCQFEWGAAKFCSNCGHKRGEEIKKEEPKQEIKKEEPKPEIKQEVKEEPKQEETKKEFAKPVTEEKDFDHCGRCGKNIEGGINALGRAWHVECFTCVNCSVSFTGGGSTAKLMMHEGNPICQNCYIDLFSEKCGVCKKPIRDGYLNVGGMMMHPECFCCTTCGQQLQGQYFKKDGKIVCKNCK